MFGVNQTQGEAGLVRRRRLMHFTAAFNLQLTQGVKSGRRGVCVGECVTHIVDLGICLQSQCGDSAGPLNVSKL